MNWRTEWRALRDRIQGLIAASQFHFEGLRVSKDDPSNVPDKVLKPQITRLFEALRQYHITYAAHIPVEARQALDRFFALHTEHFGKNVHGWYATVVTMTALTGLSAELEYHFTDQAEVARRLSERAFQHLQRSIVASPSTRAEWRQAFSSGEVACEKLGSVALLQHGTWAFKANATGERTDLVFGEPLTDLAHVERSAEALVLTEWKLVPDQTCAMSESEVVYRHINMAVNPTPPSAH